MKNILYCLLLLLCSSAIHGQVCLTLDSWAFTQNNGNGTCTYNVTVTVDSGNGASGDVDFTINGLTVHTELGCTCNPTTLSFPVTVTCGSTIDIMAFYDAPGNGNDCTGTTGAIVLPVEWHSPLTATLRDGKTLLQFSTSQETNNAHFLVQHSTDGLDYYNIEELESAGDTNLEQKYRYVHLEPFNGNNYYRVKQVDYNGDFQFSNVAKVTYDQSDLIIYPNPVKDVLNIYTPNNALSTIYNHLGQKVKDQTLVSGINELHFYGMDRGIYYIRINEKIEKIIKE